MMKCCTFGRVLCRRVKLQHVKIYNTWFKIWNDSTIFEFLICCRFLKDTQADGGSEDVQVAGGFEGLTSCWSDDIYVICLVCWTSRYWQVLHCSFWWLFQQTSHCMPILVAWHDFFTLNICTLHFEAYNVYICTVHACVKNICFSSIYVIAWGLTCNLIERMCKLCDLSWLFEHNDWIFNQGYCT